MEISRTCDKLFIVVYTVAVRCIVDMEEGKWDNLYNGETV